MSDTIRRLYYGDNLTVLRDHIPSESIDLIYLDPPFNSQADYNVIFKGQDQKGDAAQITAFTDTWTWGPDDEQILFDLTATHGQIAQFLSETVNRLGRNSLSAYLVMMSVRLLELHRVLKPTGSLYLHCDPAASHYLKIVLDMIFDQRNFRNEIIWRRTGSHGNSKRFGPVHDVIFYYTKSSEYTWTSPTVPYMRGHVKANFKQDEHGWRTNYSGNVLTGSGTRNGESGMVWRGFDPTAKGRHWAIPGKLLDGLDDDLRAELEEMGTLDKLEKLYELGLVKIIEGTVWPIYERRIDTDEGTTIGDIWAYQPYTEGTVFGTENGIDDDVRWLGTKDSERLGYPTQKPVGLLERIIKASSKAGDLVLDPFCGCGTTISAAEKLGRSWVGIDITHLSVSLIKARLRRDFGLLPDAYHEEGTPTTLEAAQYLFEQDPFEFQFWILGEIAAQPYGASSGSKKGKKGADGGIDGQMFFMRPDGGKVEKVIVSVKGGKNLTAGMVRDLAGVLTKEGAAIGVFICLAPPTAGVIREAQQQGGYEYGGKLYPRVQVLTVDDILGGKQPNIPKGAKNVSYEQKQVKSLETESKKRNQPSLF